MTVTIPHGRTRLIAVVATLLTASLPAVAWAQSPSAAPASPAPTVGATQAASAPPSVAPASSAPASSAPASPSPSGSPVWTPPAASGPITLLTAGLEDDARATAIQDAFDDTLTESCPQAVLDVQTADSAETQAEQARTALAAGSKVIVLDAVDPAAAATLVTEAQAAGATVIALGDTITGAVPDLQVAYDPPATGSIIGAVVVQVAVDAAEADLGEDASPLPSDTPIEAVVLIDGPEGDAELAAWSAKVKEGLGARATVVHEAAVDELTATEGQRVITETIAVLTTTGFGAVITPADAVAAGVIAGLREAGITPGDLSVTGLGGTLPGTQAIVAGDQLLTTWAPDGPAASIAAALACGEATGAGLPTGLTTTPVDNGTGDVPTVLLTGIVVTSDGSVDGSRSVADTIVADQAFGPDTVAAICTPDLSQACDDLGLVIPSASPAASGSPAAPPAAGSPEASPAVGSPAASAAVSPAPSAAPVSPVPSVAPVDSPATPSGSPAA